MQFHRKRSSFKFPYIAYSYQNLHICSRLPSQNPDVVLTAAATLKTASPAVNNAQKVPEVSSQKAAGGLTTNKTVLQVSWR
jgi:hypothetical protein